MKTVSIKDRWIKSAVPILQQGGVVVFPSDTVYGLLTDATHRQAVEKLISIKNRPPGKPISVFVNSFSMMKHLVTVNSRQDTVLKQLLPGPFTIIFNSKHHTDRRLESESETLGVRFPAYDPVLRLVESMGKPLTATSANTSGSPPHYDISSLLNDFPKHKLKLIDLIVDSGQLPRNKPSTVIDLTAPKLKLIRKGDLHFSKRQTYISSSPGQTAQIARHIVMLNLKEAALKPIVFILEGPMGAGKTQFVRGAAGLFGIDNIVSPTYVISYEYPVKEGYKGVKQLLHLDLFNVEEDGEFIHLGLEAYLKSGVLWFVEWGEKAKSIIRQLEHKAIIVYISVTYKDLNTREIQIGKIS